MKNSSDISSSLRKQLVSHLKGGQAFLPIDRVIEKVPFEKIGVVPDALPYSFYQQFYHIWFAQHDIINYCRIKDYKAPNWPKDYWPDETAPNEKIEWENLIQNYFTDRDQFCEYLIDTSNDLYEPFPTNKDHTLLREAELIIEHNAYHIGQLYLIARLLG